MKIINYRDLLGNEEDQEIPAPNPNPINNRRTLSILSEKKYQKTFQKLKKGLNLKNGLHFSCSTCAAVEDRTPLCGMEPEGRCICHRMRVLGMDLVGVNDTVGVNASDLVWIPEEMHCTVRDGSEWGTLGGVCFRLEVHKCTTCKNTLVHRYVNTDLEKHVVMTWSGRLQQVDREGAPEPYYIAKSENLRILKEDDE